VSNLVFRLPDLGEGLTEAALVRWIVKVGDEIVVDQPIAEVETAKSVVEVPSPFAGTVAVLHGEEGQTLDVGSPFLEVASSASAPASSDEPVAEREIAVEHEAYREEERAGSGNVLIGYGTKERRGTGRTRKPAAVASAPGKPAERSTGPVAVRSPIVRRLALSSGVDLRSIRPSAPDGVIRRADVLDAMSSTPASTSRVLAPSPVGDLEVLRREPLGMLRKTVSARLSRSRAEIPEATVWVDVDGTDLWQLRQELGDSKPSLTSLVARFVLLALAEYPVLAGRLSDDGSEIIEFDGVNLGIATNTPRGLMVPVVRHAEQHSISSLDAQIRQLAEAARDGKASPAQLTGSTFTLNNYGSFGVDGSAAIINHPEVAILGMGRMLERPWVFAGAIVPRRIVQLSLVFDHRVCDGGYAAGFLRSIVDAIEHPLALYSRI
jgi:2-oxoisovalerate dehydrogenase E2 component (dihydrolipoyl transacylase)